LADQQEVWEQVNDSCFINAKVGWGKTFTALWIAYKFRQKTLIIVHTTSLRDQWVEEVQKLFGFTPDVISQGECNFSTPIVVSNVQTLVKFANGLHKTFGTVVVDESHHTPATTMTAVLDSLSARYRVGLSGTRERKDGKHVLFNDYFGHTVFTPKKNNTLDPIVEVLKTDFKLRGGIPWTTAITELHNDRDYLEFIAEVATVKMNQGHKVLVISERTAALAALTRLLGDRVVAVSGETSKNIRNSLAKDLNSGKHDGIVAMRHVFSEGISVNPLSCLILMSPTPAGPLLEQVIGRIQRLQDGKKHPVIVDIHLTGMPEKRQNSTRLGFYHASGWSITTL
jgi:superfamily II DNA or RNA helicase